MRPYLIFVLVILVEATLAWLGGFNFDERGLGAALLSCFFLIIAIVAAFIVSARDEYHESIKR